VSPAAWPTTPCHTTPRHATPRHTTPRHIRTHTTPRHTTPHYATPHHATPHHATPHHTTQHHATPHYTTPRHIRTHTTPRHITPYHITPHHTSRHATPHNVTWPDRPWDPPSLLYDGYRIFPGGKERPGREADLSPPSSAGSRKNRAIPLLSVWAVRPVQSLTTCTRGYFTFTITIILFDKYRKPLLSNRLSY